MCQRRPSLRPASGIGANRGGELGEVLGRALEAGLRRLLEPRLQAAVAEDRRQPDREHGDRYQRNGQPGAQPHAAHCFANR
jgi:hypothetical protein